MATPYLIESTTTNIGQPLSQFQGPFKRGADWYAALNDFTIAPFGTKLVGVSKSLDDGVTWSMQDQVHEPVYGGNCSTADGGTKLSFAFNHFTPTDIRLVLFDTTTDTWGSVTTGGPTDPIFGLGAGEHLLHAILSNGDRVVCWETGTGGGNNSLKVILYNGAWQSPITIQSSSGGNRIELFGLLVDSSDRVHILRKSTATNQLIYCQFVAGALSSDTTLAGTWTSILSNYGLYLTSSDEIIFPLKGTIGSAFVNLLRGSPSASPVFTVQPVVDPTLVCDSVQIAVRPDESVLYVVTYLVDPTPFDHATIQWYSQTQPSGAWDVSPTLLWDEVTDPPTPPQTIFNDNAPISVIVTDSPLVMALTTGYFGEDQLSDDFCAIQIFIQGPLATPPSLSISCPVAPLTAAVGMLFTSDPPVVTGDTPPDTFALLDGPGWMGIDPDTGIVSGTPDTSGDITYTIQVTDSLGNMADTSPGCPLTVIPFSIACPVANTGQIGVPYTGQIIVSGGTPPYVFSIV